MDGLTNEESKVLQDNGILLNRGAGQYYEVKKFGADILVTPQIVVHSPSIFKSKVITYSSAVNPDFAAFDPSEAQKSAAETYRKTYNKSLWEEYGRLEQGSIYLKVTALYLTDLKNEIATILRDYKRQQEGFANAISNGTQQANSFNFDVAEGYLNHAKEYSNGSYEHRSTISDLEKLIASKKEEAKKSASSSATSRKDDSREGEDSKEAEKLDTKKETTFNRYSAYSDYMRYANNARAQGDYAAANRYLQMAKDLNIYGTHDEIDKQMTDNNLRQLGDAAAPLLANAFDNTTGINGIMEFAYINDKEEWKQYKLGWVNQAYWWNFFSVTFGTYFSLTEETPVWIRDDHYYIPQSELTPDFSSYISEDRFAFRDITTSSSTINMTYKVSLLST